MSKPDGPEDWIVLWNRQHADEQIADEWERRGGTVIVTENGYLQRIDKTHYAISVHGHNGSGWFPVGSEDRFTKLNIPLKPWRVQLDKPFHLVCGQRGVGSKAMKSPVGWAEGFARKLREHGIAHKLRPHPGNFAPKVPLVDDLQQASVCNVWSSAAGVMALVEGVEVRHSAPHWICADGSSELGRLMALHKMSWGQWHFKEIETGEPFARLIDQREKAKW
jgi:hypothetical protein